MRFQTTTSFTLFLFVITHTVIKAQHYPHFTMWSRIQVAKEPSDAWKYTGTFLWRRQNNYQINPKNPLANHLMIGGQGLITYRNLKNTIWVHIAQLTYMFTNQLVGKQDDFNAPMGKEFRYAAGVEFNQEVNEKLTFRERFMQELRFHKANDFQPVGRVRGRGTVRYQVKPYVSLNAVTEILFHDPPLLLSQTPFRFHQFWLGGSLIWDFSERVSLETGYTFIHGRRATIVEFDEQNVMSFYLSIDI